MTMATQAERPGAITFKGGPMTLVGKELNGSATRCPTFICRPPARWKPSAGTNSARTAPKPC